MTQVQRVHVTEAQRDRNNLTTVNHGHPPHPAVDRPLTATNRAPGYKPVTAADRQAAQRAKSGDHNGGKPPQ